MGRTQVSHSARPQVHSAPATSKIAANTKVQQQIRPTSSSTKPKPHPNAQVYRPTPVAEHPDDAFMTGAWMFDQSRVPQWMQSQLPKATTNTSKSAATQKRSTTTTTVAVSPKQMQQPVKQLQSKPMTQSKPNMAAKSMQQHKQSTSTSMHNVIRPTPVYEHPDTAFLSGAWLFDTSRTPLWMQREVPVAATALIRRSRRLATDLPLARAKRPHSTKHYFNVNWTGFKTFGATPHAVIPVGSVKARTAHPDDAFFSGAWMFDAKCAPSWLAQELGKGKQQQVHVQKNKTSHTQIAGVKLTSGRKLGV